MDLRDSAGGDSALNAQRRTRELEQFANGDSVDVLVIGGGITGVGVALDAVTRGLVLRWSKSTTSHSAPAAGVRNWHTAAFGTSPPAMSV